MAALNFIRSMRFASIIAGIGWAMAAFSFLPSLADNKDVLRNTGILIAIAGIIRQWIIQQRINRIAMTTGDRG